MVLIINKDSTNINYNDENMIVLRSVCDLKTYECTSYTIVLIDIEIDDEGIVEKYNFSFEEIIITLDVVAVITNKKSNTLQEICNYHKIPLLVNKY